MITNQQLVEAHVNCNLGIYFDGLESLGGGVFYVYSESIEDAYWNFGYKLDGSALSRSEVAKVASCAKSHQRAAAIWQRSDEPRLADWDVISDEVWMTADLAKVGRFDHDRAFAREHKRPTDAMVAVFEDAYGGEPGEGEVGYSALPQEYGEAYRLGVSRPPARSWVVEAVLSDDATSAAVASVCLFGELAGVFSVATRHGYRRQGLGRFVSAMALDIAIREGAHVAFLQTEPDSPVQEMYESLGFRVQFVGTLLGPPEPTGQ